MANSKIIVALDGMNEEKALTLARELTGNVWGFKVNDLLIDCGLSIISKLKDYGHVFADPKLHDIPNTVANAIAKLDTAGADLITVHASGGRQMLEAAAQASKTAKILAVTILTSLNAENCDEIYGRNPQEGVVHFAQIAAQSGVTGIVCSSKELSLLQTNKLTESLLKVIPGIRPAWHQKKDDQARTMTPREAVENGAGLLVIGRPIITHPHPKEAAQMVAEELNG